VTFRRRRGSLKKRYGRPDSGSSRSFRRCLRCSWLGALSKTHTREGKVVCPKCGGENLMVIK
jgi:hypothetical protein